MIAHSAPQLPVEPTSIRTRIATSWSGLDIPFGLGAPMQLSGGDALAPDRLPLNLHLDWAPELQAAVSTACLRQSATGRPWFTMEPTCISARKGTGRTLLARHIARTAGVPFVVMDVRRSFAEAQLRTGLPDIAFPSVPLLAIAASGCANPVILVTGVDEAAEQQLDQLAAMIDPTTSARWNEPGLRVLVDLSHITWLIESSATCGAPKRLSQVQQIDVVLTEETARLRSLTMIAEVLADLNGDRRVLEGMSGTLIGSLDGIRTQPAAQLRPVAETAVRAALARRP